MTRLEKELRNRGIIFEADELDIMRGAENDQESWLIGVTDMVIIIGWASAVVPSRYQLYDRKTFEFIGSQQMEKETQFFYDIAKMNPWDVQINIDKWTEEDEEARAWAQGVAPFQGEDPFICAEDWM